MSEPDESPPSNSEPSNSGPSSGSPSSASSVTSDTTPLFGERQDSRGLQKFGFWIQGHKRVRSAIAIGAAILIVCSIVIFSPLFHGLQSKTEQRQIFTHHTERIYEEKTKLKKKEVCVEANTEYNKNFEVFYSDCSNGNLTVVNSLVNITHVTSADLNFYFHFDEMSFVNITAKGGFTYYRFTKDAGSANKFSETTCRELEKNKESVKNITNKALQIFENKGYYHICFDRDESSPGIRSSFKMSITEFYKEISDKDRMNCTYANTEKNEKCCPSPARTTFCVYFFSRNNTFDPVTKLNPLTVRISYDDKLNDVPYVFVAIACLAFAILAFAILVGFCYCAKKGNNNMSIN